MYLSGTIVLALLIAGLIFFRVKIQEPEVSQAANTGPTAMAKTASFSNGNVGTPEFAPPPPPEEDDEAPVPFATAQPGLRPCKKCSEGETSETLNRKLSRYAVSTAACQLRKAKEGKFVVAVIVGSDGSVCEVEIVEDGLGSKKIAKCVVSKFERRRFPEPKKGCVVVNIPLTFEAD
ncbi:AgmX/PglI C-terminal domain-containing protein [Endomicrobium sp. AH-315-J14]|nr:AgmX/PglI C-terminal domain-containing protein [Endomicrobium sp. AH-315-J14]